MKNKNSMISLFLLGIILFNFSFGFAQAFDDNEPYFTEDNDNINDDFEDINKRDVEVDIVEDEIHIFSVRRSDTNKDQIGITVTYNPDGISFIVRYKSKSEMEYEFNIAFGVIFREIIEFIDTNEDGVYNPEADENIQNVQLKNFTSVFYETTPISNNSELHHLRILTVDEIFSVNFYIAEEFTLLDEILLTPSQIKIDIEISNFNYTNENSQLALSTLLDSEAIFEAEEETEDEEYDYSSNEQGVITTMGNHTGYFTWSKIAVIDEILEEISVSPLLNVEHGQKIFICYARGENIYHDPRLGIEGILIPLTKSEAPPNLVVLFLLIGAVSMSVIYATYHLVSNRVPTKKREKDRDEYFNELYPDEEDFIPYNERPPLQILFEENPLDKLSRIKNLNLTVVSKKFFESVNQFEWDQSEKEDFIREMLALSPFERNSFLEEMVAKS